jgi:D-alanyl-D-alanine carboxypeptidase
MPKSTPRKRSPLFIFGPPVLLSILGFGLLIQSGILASPKLEMINEQNRISAAQGLVPPTLGLTDYIYPRLTIESANQPLVVVNKQRALDPIDFAPSSLVVMPSSKSLDNSRDLVLASSAANALVLMAEQMHAEGYGQLFVNSAYRTYDYQVELFESKTRQYGLAGALVRSAKAGHSEHQTGLAVDVSVPAQGCAIMTCFGETAAGKWVASNSWQFGFIVRYEEETTAITGYSYEPWHLRFVGEALAAEYSENGIHTLEEFWSLPAAEFYPEEGAESKVD